MADTIVLAGRTVPEARSKTIQRAWNLGAVMLGPIDFIETPSFDGEGIQVVATVEILMDPAIPLLWHAHMITD